MMRVSVPRSTAFRGQKGLTTSTKATQLKWNTNVSTSISLGVRTNGTSMMSPVRNYAGDIKSGGGAFSDREKGLEDMDVRRKEKDDLEKLKKILAENPDLDLKQLVKDAKKGSKKEDEGQEGEGEEKSAPPPKPKKEKKDKEGKPKKVKRESSMG